MSDIHTAAVLLMTLPEEAAGELMSKLDPKQVEQVSIEIARTRMYFGGRAGAGDQGTSPKRTPQWAAGAAGWNWRKSLIQKALGQQRGRGAVEHSAVDRGGAIWLFAERR